MQQQYRVIRNSNPYLHSADVFLEGGVLIPTRGRLVTQEFGNLLPVLAVLMDAQLQILRKLLIKLLVILSIFCQLSKQLEASLDEVLANNLQDLALLEGFTRNVKRQIFGIDNTLHEIEVLWDKLFAVFHDEHTSHIQLDVILDLSVLEQIKGSSLRHKQKGAELELSFNREVLYGEMLLPIVGKGLVELTVLILGYIARVTGPDRFCFVELLDILVLFFDSFRLFLRLFFFISLVVFLYLLNLRFVVLEMK